jgi:hypothetical protein
VIAVYPEEPVDNGGDEEPMFFADEITVADDEQPAAYSGQFPQAPQWVVMRQSILWNGKRLRMDTHLVGPFATNGGLDGPYGVAHCSGSGAEIWAKAADILHHVTPHAVTFLKS